MIDRNLIFLHTFLLGLALLIPVSGFAKNMDVAFANDRINIYADNASLSLIVEELSRQMGIKVYLDKTQTGNSITVDIRNASFEKGLKMLTYPLNYVIMRGDQGEIRELRIFKNPGLADNNYKVFAHANTAVSSQQSAVSSQPSASSSQLPATSIQQPAASSQQQASSVQNPASKKTVSPETGSSEPVTGEKAFNYGMWAVKRMMEAESIREQTQVKAEQAKSVQNEVSSLQNVINVSNITQQPAAQTLQVPASSNVYPNYSANYSMGATGSSHGNDYMRNYAQMMNYMQYMSQQRSFNEFIYQQQKFYSNYNSTLNSRGPAAK